MIKQLRFYLLMAMLLAACGTMRKNQEWQRLNVKTEAASQKDSHRLAVATVNESITDSTAGDYVIQIWPTGYFTYDNINGYKGMASQLVWKGKTNHKRIADRHKTSLNQMDQAQTVSTSVEKSTVDKKLEKTKRVLPFWIWMIIALVALLGSALLVMKIRKL